MSSAVPPLACPISVNTRHSQFLVLGVDLLIKEVLRQQVQLAVLLPDGVRPDKLELFQCKLIELVLHFPDGRLLQLGNRLPRGRLLLTGLPQVRFLSWK